MNAKIGAARLGFGCAAIPGSLTRREALALLETAFACGLRHFDTARMYCSGQSEELLGELAQGRRDELIIVTKAGLSPPSWPVRGLRKVGVRLPQRETEGRFTPVRIRRSVETSLRKLRTDHLNALLLHEIRPHDVSDDLKRVLEDLRREGKIGGIGIATSVADSEALIAAHAELCKVVQVPAQWLDRPRALPSDARLIVHSVLGRRLDQFLDRLRTDDHAARQFKAEAGLTTLDKSQIGRLMLQAAMARNPHGVTLFATSRVERIKQSAHLLTAELNDPAVQAMARGLDLPRPAGVDRKATP